MKSRITIGLMIIVSFSFAQTKEEQEVADLCQKKFRWMIEAKSDSLRDILDDQLTYIHSNGWVQTKTDVINDLTNGRIVYQKIEVQDLKARLYKETAIVNGRGKFTYLAGGMMLATTDLMFTETYLLINKKWKLVARHANKMP
jgi:hypothetical protein